MHLPSFIHLYNGGKTESLNIERISQYLKHIFKRSEIQIRNDFISHYLSEVPFEYKEEIVNNLANRMARIKIRKIESKEIVSEPLQGEIEYEKRRISDSKNKSFGILYNGFKLMSIFSKLISEEKSDFNHCHIIFTNQLFGTWDEQDLRYHARVSIYGFPSIVSTTGIVEAPAKPREFYLKKQIGIDIETLKKEFFGRFIDYNDPRLTEIINGYVMQALFYQVTGNPFCDDKNCRLFNAHWQEEVIQAQLKSNCQFCHHHKKVLEEIKCGKS